MTDYSNYDKYQLGQLIRFNAHMIDIATRSDNPDIEKKKAESEVLENLLNIWKGKGLPEREDILWAKEKLKKFKLWANNPKNLSHRPAPEYKAPREKDLITVIRNRRSIRYWKKEPVPEESIHQILEAGLYAPSAFNRLPWRFFVAHTAMEKLKEGDASNPGMFRQAPARIFVTVDERLFFEKYSGPLDAGLAMQNMLLTAHSLGLGTCLIYQGEFVDPDKLEKYYRIPTYCKVYCVILLGYPDEIPETPARPPVEEVTKFLGEIENPEF